MLMKSLPLRLLLILFSFPLSGADLPALPSIDVPRLAVAPLITADLQDPAWDLAAEIPSLGLSRRNPPQALPAQATTVRLGWDAGFLYVRFICHDDELFLPVSGRDAELYRGDAVEVFLDVVGDGAAVTELQFSPGGDAFDQMILLTRPLVSDGDGLISGDLRNRDLWMDRAWNMEGLRWAAQPSETGWVVDVAIPAHSALRRLGFDDWRPMTLSANVLRYDHVLTAGKRELVSMDWSRVQYGCPHLSPSRMGKVRLVD